MLSSYSLTETHGIVVVFLSLILVKELTLITEEK